MEKKISYLNRTFSDYKEALIEMSKRYYPDLNNSFRDASVAEWQIDMLADIADNLSYHIDRVFQETNIDSAQEKSSLYAIARNCGVKIPGPKGAIAEVKITAVMNDLETKLVIKRGTKFAAGSQQFELLYDIDFSSQFDINGVSDRTIVPRVTTNGINNGYTVSKLAVVIAGETRIFSQFLTVSDVKPFMEIVLPVEGVMNIESILVRKGNSDSLPTYGTFYGTGCTDTTRFYEVDNLAQNKCWLDAGTANTSTDTPSETKTTKTTNSNDSSDSNGSSDSNTLFKITKGEWRPIEHKFITEYTDKGYLKVIFGAVSSNDNDTKGVSNNNKWTIDRFINNNYLGTLPQANSTIFILYRVGGGVSSNVGKGAINRISYLNAEIPQENSDIIRSLKVENTTPSISGKDMPSENEIKYLIKYNKSAQERCVTLKDYIDRLLLLPPKYGTPFRIGVAEENNKIVIYLLGIDEEGHLSRLLPTILVENIKDYISEYKMLGDYIEIKSGKIVNIAVDVDAIMDKNYDEKEIASSIIKTVEEYFNINRHLMGGEIYVGDLQKEIGKIDGVINLISLKIYNVYGENYSNNQISQEVISGEDSRDLVDLEASDWVLYNDGDTMMEVKFPNDDIKIRLKKR